MTNLTGTANWFDNLMSETLPPSYHLISGKNEQYKLQLYNGKIQFALVRSSDSDGDNDDGELNNDGGERNNDGDGRQ